MKFEWSDRKNKENVKKHLLDFADAWEIFRSPMLIDVDHRVDYGEIRFIGIGMLRDLIVVLVFTEPEDDTIRIISLRRALKYEREKFYAYLKKRLGKTE